MIEEKDIKKLAELARINLSPDEIPGFKKDIQEILDYFEQLKEVETEGVEELVHPLETKNVFREDEPKDIVPEESQALIKQAALKRGNYINVKKILDA